MNASIAIELVKQVTGTLQDGMGNEIAKDGKMPELLNKYFLTIQSELVHPNQFAKAHFCRFKNLSDLKVNGKCILED